MNKNDQTKRIFIDLREPFEMNNDQIEGSLNITPSDIMAGAKALEGIDKDAELVLYCISGSRSNVAIPLLRNLGFTNLTNGINSSHVKKLYF